MKYITTSNLLCPIFHQQCRSQFRDPSIHPSIHPSIPSHPSPIKSFEHSKPVYGDLKQTKEDPLEPPGATSLQSVTFQFKIFSIFWIVSDSVSKKFGIEKLSDSISKKIWSRKKYRIRYQKNLVLEKSFGFGFVQILGIVTHCFRGVLT